MGMDITYYGGKRRIRNGIGVIVSQNLKDNILAVNRLSDRLM